jgi:Right handed beta helix region
MKINATLAVGLALVGALSAAPAQAQSVRTFVSPTGVDTAACSLTAPCRTFAAAYAATDAGGEIAVLGTAGYGTLTINKAISIVNGGGFEAAIAVPSGGGAGITIAAGTMDAVSLRGLTIDGAGVGGTGIIFNTGKSLTVENCVVRHMMHDGIFFQSTTATSALTVSNSLVADNGANGIELVPTGSATAVFNRVEVNNNAAGGIVVNGGNSAGSNSIDATVSDGVVAGNVGIGFFSLTPSGSAPTSLMLFHSVAANNGTGVEAQGSGATLRLANSTVTGNATGWVATSSGVMQSYGDNYIDGNASNQTAPPSIARK